MPQEIELPDGSIGEFPDDMAPEAIEAVLRRQFPAKSAGPQPPALPFLPPLPGPANPILAPRATAQSAANRVLSGDYGLEASMYAQEGDRIADRASGVAAGARAVASGPTLNARLGGASRMIREAGAAAAPYALPLGVVGAAASGGLPALAANAALGMAAQEGAERGAKALGAGEGTAAFLGDVASLPNLAGAAKSAVGARPRTSFLNPRMPAAATPPEVSRGVLSAAIDAEKRALPPVLPQSKSAAEAGAAFLEIPAPKDAQESASVFDRVLSARESKAPPRDVRRASTIPVDDTPPEGVLRAQDRRDRLSREVFEKPWSELTNPERLLIDEEITGVRATLAEVPKNAQPQRIVDLPERIAENGAAAPVPAPQDRIAASAEQVAPEVVTGRPPVSPARREAQGGAVTFPITRKDIENKALQLRTDYADRFAPIDEATYRVPDGAGGFIDKKVGDLPFEQNPFKQARSFGGVKGIVANRIDDLGEIIRPAAKEGILDDAVKHMVLERHAEKYAQIPDYKAPGVADLADAQAQRAALATAMGPERMKKIGEVSAKIRNWSDGLLTYLEKNGVISPERLNDIREANKAYIPFNRLAKLADDLEQPLMAPSSRFSVAENTALARLKGSDLEIADPIESLVRNANRLIHLAERNNVSRKLGALAQDSKFGGAILKLKPDQRPADGFEKLSYLDGGKRVDYAVPEGVAEAMAGMSEQYADTITRTMANWARMLRAGVTTFPGFVATNIARDVQTAAVTTRLPGALGLGPKFLAQGFVAALTRGIKSEKFPKALQNIGAGRDTYRSFRESKGAFGGFYHGQSPQVTGRDLKAGPVRKVLNSITDVRGAADAMELLSKPMQAIGETAELTTRLGAHRRALSLGKTHGEAGWIARNASVDFERRGAAMKTWSMVIPFLNANIQGRLNLYGALKEAPLATGMRLAAVAGVPAVATYMFNRTYFPKEYDSLDPVEKQGNLILIYGSGRDADGNLTEALKVPKGDTAPFVSAVEESLEAMRKNEPLKWQKLARQTMSDFSPVPFAKEGELSATAVGGTVLPPPLKALAEAGLGTNFYTGRPIEPEYLHGVRTRDLHPTERFRSNTTPWLRTASKALDKVGVQASPLILENTMGTVAGHWGRALAKPGSIGENTASMTGKRFLGARTKSVDQNMMDTIRREEQAEAKRDVEIGRTVDTVLDEAFKLPQEQRADYVRKQIAEASQRLQPLFENQKPEQIYEALGKEFMDAATKRARGVTREERALMRLQATPRAKVLLDQMRSMDRQNLAPTLERWRKLKILTPKVEQEIMSIGASAQ